MTKVKKITISGFRGICAKLDLDLQKDGQAQSTILYGANGTGKSSITDAWEWLVTGKIQHLAREGAEEGAYRNWSIHCKNPVTPIQTDEIRTIVANWKTILKAVQCQECFELLKYDGRSAFQCICGKSQLNRTA